MDIPWKSFNKRVKEDSAFAELVEIGRLYAKAWWLRQMRTNLHSKSFNVSGWFAVMKNRFGWSDKAEITDPMADKPVDQLSDSELSDRIMAHKNKIITLMKDKNATLAELLKDGPGTTN